MGFVKFVFFIPLSENMTYYFVMNPRHLYSDTNLGDSDAYGP